VWGNAVSALDFLRRAPALDCVYVPIGLGSGACALIAARDALKLPTRIIGVASEQAPAYALSFDAKRVVTADASTRIADGMACSTPDGDALEHILLGADRIVRVSDDQTEAAMRAYFSDTHNVAEGAGLAAVLSGGAALRGKRVGVIFTGGNVDSGTFARVLAAG